MKISLASGVYLNFPLEEAIHRVAAAGYDGIDIWSGRPHAYRKDFSDRQLDHLRSKIEGLGLSVSSFMPAFYRYPYDLSSPNIDIRQDSLVYMRECMDSAALLGAPTVLVVPKRSLHGQSLKESWKRLADSIDDLCRYAQQYEFKLGLEAANPYVTDLVNTAADALRMIEQVGHDNLGAVIDSGHIHLSTESAQEAIDTLGQRLLQVHVNDNDGQQQQNLVPGEGSFDFVGLVDKLHNVGYEGFLSAELSYQYTLDPDPVVHQTAQRMREWLQPERLSRRIEKQPPS